jgi:hypothetical protein
MISSVIHRAIRTATHAAQPNDEHFRLNHALNAMTDSKESSVNGKELVTVLITFIIVLFILAFVGQFLWNAFIAGDDGGTGLITCARPATSVWQILGLYVFVGLFIG